MNLKSHKPGISTLVCKIIQKIFWNDASPITYIWYNSLSKSDDILINNTKANDFMIISAIHHWAWNILASGFCKSQAQLASENSNQHNIVNKEVPNCFLWVSGCLLQHKCYSSFNPKVRKPQTGLCKHRDTKVSGSFYWTGAWMTRTAPGKWRPYRFMPIHSLQVCTGAESRKKGNFGIRSVKSKTVIISI